MDALERMFEDEREALDFLPQEEFTEVEMHNTGEITGYQDEALSAYNRVPQSEAAPFLQAAMLAEIALQLAGIDEKLQKIAGDGELGDLHTQLLKDIIKGLRDLRK